jgi:hypothetical protein
LPAPLDCLCQHHHAMVQFAAPSAKTPP